MMASNVIDLNDNRVFHASEWIEVSKNLKGSEIRQTLLNYSNG